VSRFPVLAGKFRLFGSKFFLHIIDLMGKCFAGWRPQGVLSIENEMVASSDMGPLQLEHWQLDMAKPSPVFTSLR
jgi:hypothetical protein